MVESTVKQIAPLALIELGWTESVFAEILELSPEVETAVCERVWKLVTTLRANGARRHEVSLASKVLHWLLPWRIPVYDKVVRTFIGAAESPEAYRQVVRWEYEAARRPALGELNWDAMLEPRSPFRALDKYLWWEGGGDKSGPPAIVDPWAVVRRLGIPCT